MTYTIIDFVGMIAQGGMHEWYVVIRECILIPPRTVVAAEVLLVFNYDWWAKGERDGFPPLVHTNH